MVEVATQEDPTGRPLGLDVRDCLWGYLAEVGERRMIPVFRRAFATADNQSKRRRAAWLLAEVGDTESFDAIVSLMKREEDWYGAVAALGELKDPRVPPLLRAALAE